MTKENAAVAMYSSHESAEAAVKEIPVAGHIIVLGPLVATIVSALEGAAVGGSAGVLGGALASVGIPKNSVVKYEKQIAAGEFLVLAHGTSDEIERARGILQRAGASSVEALAA